VIYRKLVLLIFLLCTPHFVCARENFEDETESLTKSKTSNFIVITAEKCGTFLLSKALKLITGKEYIHYYPRKVVDLQDFLSFTKKAQNNNQFVFCHVNPDRHVIDSLKKSGYKVLFILRDPRDQLISGMHMIRNGHPLAGIPPNQFNLLDQNAQIDELITGDIFGHPIFEACYERQLPWTMEDSDFVHVSRFEHLVGSKGGGDDHLQIQTIKSLGRHLHMKILKHQAKKVAKQLFGETWSFRQGRLGSYKQHFTDHHKELYKTKYDQVLIDLYYEDDIEW